MTPCRYIMQSNVPSQYRDLLRQAIREGSVPTNNDRPLKKRKKHRSMSPDLACTDKTRELKTISNTKSERGKVEIISLSSGEELSNQEGNSTEEGRRNDKEQEIYELDDNGEDDRKIGKTGNYNSESNNEDGDNEDEDYDDDDFDSDEFEDVDLEHAPDQVPDYETERKEINIPIKIQKRKKKRKTVVSREERQFRKQIHMLCLFTMVAHGVSRNSWCSDPNLLNEIKKGIPNNITKKYLEYLKHRKLEKATVSSKTRQLLDILRQLMIFWYRSWTINESAPALYKRSWDELDSPVPRQRMSKRKFIKAVKRHTGSRDIAAQGFVSLLRSIGLQARLVFSLQPPDFTNLSQVTAIAKKHNREFTKKREKVQKKVEKHMKRRAAISQRDRLLNNLRVHRNANTNYRPSDEDEESDIEEEYPVFWCEVWDKDAKRFITVDPIVKKTIEIVKTKSMLEPPTTSEHNNAYYVLGYDRLGGVCDITRRYAEHYNAKVRKKRITRDEEGEKWYNSLLAGACSVRRNKRNRIDKFEELEFEERSLREGMPNSLQDFKNHPIYVLENQLKANEVLCPRISCGSIRKKNKYNKTGELIPVYKRSNVQLVRSAKAWYMRGRVLKIGERPLKSRKKDKLAIPKDPDNYQISDTGGDEEDEVRLYAESQTEKFVPPDIAGDEIPHNVFGNMDVYRPWMVPQGCVHIPDDNAEKAAKLMGIEFVPAAVGFDFDGGSRGSGSRATVKIQGIVTFEEYEPAVKLISQGLREYEEEKAKKRRQLIAFRAWRILFKKMEIINRLNQEHGKVSDKRDKRKMYNTLDSSDDDKNEAEHNTDDEGGFILGDAQNVDENMYFGDGNDDIGNVSESEFDNEQGDDNDNEEYSKNLEHEDAEIEGEKTDMGVDGKPEKSSSQNIEDGNADESAKENHSEYEDFMNDLGLNSTNTEEGLKEAGGFVRDDSSKSNSFETVASLDRNIEEDQRSQKEYSKDDSKKHSHTGDVQKVEEKDYSSSDANQHVHDKTTDNSDEYDNFMRTMGFDKPSEESAESSNTKTSPSSASLNQNGGILEDEEDIFVQNLSKDLAGYADNLSTHTIEKKNQEDEVEDTIDFQMKSSASAGSNNDIIYMSEHKENSPIFAKDGTIADAKTQKTNSNKLSPIEISSDSESAEIIDLDDESTGDEDGYEFEYSDSL